jgi:hypothetical protein
MTLDPNFFHHGSRIPDANFFYPDPNFFLLDPGSRIHIIKYFNPEKLVFQLSEI